MTSIFLKRNVLCYSQVLFFGFLLFALFGTHNQRSFCLKIWLERRLRFWFWGYILMWNSWNYSASKSDWDTFCHRQHTGKTHFWVLRSITRWEICDPSCQWKSVLPSRVRVWYCSTVWPSARRWVKIYDSLIQVWKTEMRLGFWVQAFCRSCHKLIAGWEPRGPFLIFWWFMNWPTQRMFSAFAVVFTLS